jgi:hypothetical protein
MKAKVIFLLIICVSMPYIVGCGDGSSKLIGKWVQTANHQNKLEFLSDKTVILEEGSQTFGGKWNILEDGRIKTEISVWGMNLILIGSVQGGILTLKGSGMTLSYKKLNKE